jgi:hypothetical protein
MFGFLYMGNLIDNSNSAWWHIAFCEIACALLLIWEAAILLADTDSDQSYYNENQGRIFLAIFHAGINIITILQLYNWFPKRIIGTILSLWILLVDFGFAL